MLPTVAPTPIPGFGKVAGAARETVGSVVSPDSEVNLLRTIALADTHVCVSRPLNPRSVPSTKRCVSSRRSYRAKSDSQSDCGDRCLANREFEYAGRSGREPQDHLRNQHAPTITKAAAPSIASPQRTPRINAKPSSYLAIYRQNAAQLARLQSRRLLPCSGLAKACLPCRMIEGVS